MFVSHLCLEFFVFSCSRRGKRTIEMTERGKYLEIYGRRNGNKGRVGGVRRDKKRKGRQKLKSIFRYLSRYSPVYPELKRNIAVQFPLNKNTIL